MLGDWPTVRLRVELVIFMLASCRPYSIFGNNFFGKMKMLLISSDIIRNRILPCWMKPDPLIIKTPHTQGGPSLTPFFSFRRAALYGSGGVRASRAYLEELENASGIPTHINLGHQTTRSQKSCNLSQVDIVSRMAMIGHLSSSSHR